MKKLLTIFCLFTLIFSESRGQSQNPKIQFNGTGRAIVSNQALRGNATTNDTVNPKLGNNGHTLLDLNVNIIPNSTTQINAVMRLRNEFGGFYGSGASVILRQIYARGVIGKIVNYQVGDINLKKTKYTFFNSFEEGSVNESEVFSIPKNIVYYENFNNGNTWRQQGAQLDYAIKIGNAIEKLSFDGFVTRQRGAVYPSVSDKLYSGGSIEMKQSKYLTLTGNYVNLFDVPSTTSLPEFQQNPVMTGGWNLELDKEKIKYSLFGEAGASKLYYRNQPVTPAPADLNGSFFDAGVGVDLKALDLNVKLSYRKVDNDFISAGAQTKRVNYSLFPNLFTLVTKDKLNRPVSLFDISRDNNIYNMVLTEQLMAYDPRLANAMPYGTATPNRKGFTIDANYKNKNEKADAFLSAAFLSDVKGQGTAKLRDFMLIRTGTNLFVNKLLGFDRNCKINLGLQLEKTSRSGDSIENINLNSQLIDAGIEIETIRKLDILAGAKMLVSKGNEYIAKRDQYNAVKINDYLKYNIDGSETMMGFGLKYRFTSKIFLTAQGQFFSVKNKMMDTSSYNINQFFLLYNMSF